ncbi:MAG: murein transglycosylase [Silanimonas sp.]|nr:MAG: murein transglycosylase [Silanimonas sp.]
MRTAPATFLRPTLAVLALLGLGPALAGTLYRCVGADGISHYGSKRLPGMQCTVAAQYRPDPRPAVRPAPPPTPAPVSAASAPPVGGAPGSASMAAPGRRVEFLSLPGDAPPPAAPAVKGARVTRGAVYTYVKDGVTHYTNVRPRNAGAPVRTLFTYIETCYACAALPGVDFSTVRLNTTAYAEEIRAAARQHGVDEALVRAVMHAESAFNPNALSHKGAQGLMQLIPATAQRFGVQDPFDPAQNIRGGVQYLRWLLDRYGNDITLAAAGYNAGEGNVDRHGGVPPFQETQLYVSRVATLHARYREALAAGGGAAGAATGAVP